MSHSAAGAPKYDLFLSYRSTDAEPVSTIGKLLKLGGLRTFRDRDDLVAGQPWQPALQAALQASRGVAVFVGRDGLGAWQLPEVWMALDLQVQATRKGLAFPVIPVLLPGSDPSPCFLYLNTWVDLRQGAVEEGVQLLQKAVRSRARTGRKSQWNEFCPYRGLDAFREEDEPLYFGRKVEVAQVIDLLTAHAGLPGPHISAVIGPSGSGKSSLVRAGVVPALRRQRPASRTWEVATFTPGPNPWRSLAAPLVAALQPDSAPEHHGSEVRALAAELEGGKGALENAAREILERHGADRLLLVVDQFEQALLGRRPETQTRFLEELLAASAAPEISVLVTIRGDYYGPGMNPNAGIFEALRRSHIFLSAMQEKDLGETISGPARRVNLQLEDGLKARLVNDLKTGPGSLPLLEYALTELWNGRRNGCLTHAAYEEIGGVQGAIASKAESIFKSLATAQQRETAKWLFLRLVHVGHREGQDASIRATRLEVGVEAWRVAEIFAEGKARLLVMSRDPETGEETVQLAHDALLTAWSRIQEWSATEHDFLTWRQSLGLFLAQRTAARTGPESVQDAVMGQARHWLEVRRDQLNPPEVDFLFTAIHDPPEIRALLAQTRMRLRNPRIRDYPEIVADWCTALVCAGKFEDVRAEVERSKGATVPRKVIAALICTQTIANAPDYAREILKACLNQPVQGREQKEEIQGEAAEAFARMGDVESCVAALGGIGQPGELRTARAVAVAPLLTECASVEAGLRVANLLDDLNGRRQVFQAIARKLLGTGRGQDAAYVAARAMRDLAEPQYPQSGPLAAVLQILVKAGLGDRALECAGQVRVRSVRESLLAVAAMEIARAGDPGRALALAEEIGAPDLQGGVWIAAAEAWLAAGQVEQAETIGRQCELPRYSSAILILAGQALAGIGKPAAAHLAAQEAALRACQIRDYDARDSILAGVCRLESRLGNFKEARRKAGQVQNLQSRRDLLVGVARDRGRAGNLRAAYRTARHANQFAQDPLSPDRVLRTTITEIARDLAQTDLARTMDFLQTHLPDRKMLAQVVAGLDVALARAGKIESALQAGTQIVQMTADAAARSKPAVVARIAAQAGFSEEVLRAADSTADPGLARDLRVGAAEALVSAGEIERVYTIAGLIADDRIADPILAALAAGLAQAGRFPEAEDAARRVRDAVRKNAVLAGVAQAALRSANESGPIERAVSILTQIDPERLAAPPIIRLLTRAWARAGRPGEALAAARKAQTATVLLEAQIGIAAGLAKGGHASQARPILELAFPALNERIVSFRKSPAARAQTPESSAFWSGVGEAAQAWADVSGFDEAISVARLIGNDNIRQEMLAAIIERLAEGGQMDRALDLIETTLSEPRQIVSTYERVQANPKEVQAIGLRIRTKAKVAQLLASFGAPDRAMQTLEISEPGEELEASAPGSSRVREQAAVLAALAEIVHAYARAGSPEAALSMPGKVRDESMRSRVVAEIVRRFEPERLLETVLGMQPIQLSPNLQRLMARELARAGMVPQALRAAAAIEDKPTQTSTLVELAQLFLQDNHAGSAREAALQALADVEEPQYQDRRFLASMVEILTQAGNAGAAVEASQRLGNRQLCAELLLTVALELANGGKAAEARNVCEQTGAGMRRPAFAGVATALAEAGHVREAQSIAQELGDPPIDGLQAALACAWAVAGKPSVAMEAAHRILDRRQRGLALLKAAQALSEPAGNPDANTFAVRAFEELSDGAIKDLGNLPGPILILAKTASAGDAAGLVERAVRPQLWSAALTSLARAMTRAGRFDEACRLAGQTASRELQSQILQEAEAVVSPGQNVEIAIRAALRQSPYARPRLLAEMARDLANAGRWTEAANAANQAVAALRELEDQNVRAGVARDVGEQLAAAGLIDQTLAAAEDIRPPHAQKCLTSLAVHLAGSGQGQMAYPVVERLKEPGAQQQALGDMAKAFARAGLAEDARAAIRAIRDEAPQSQLMAEVVQALAAKRRLEEARATAQQIGNAEIAAQALVLVSREFANAGNLEEARTAAAAAWSEAGKIESSDTYSSLLVSISGAFALAEWYSDAISALEGCERSADRLAASSAILYWYAVHSNPDVAKRCTPPSRS